MSYESSGVGSLHSASCNVALDRLVEEGVTQAVFGTAQHKFDVITQMGMMQARSMQSNK